MAEEHVVTIPVEEHTIGIPVSLIVNFFDAPSNTYRDNYAIFLAIAVISVLIYSYIKYKGISAKAATITVKILSAVFAIISLLAALYSLGFFAGFIEEVLFLGGDIIIPSAFAETKNPALTPNQILSVYIVGGIFLLMFITFLAAIFVIFFKEENDGNKNKIAAADSIVKTFGGFFIGVATSFANQNIV